MNEALKKKIKSGGTLKWDKRFIKWHLKICPNPNTCDFNCKWETAGTWEDKIEMKERQK